MKNTSIEELIKNLENFDIRSLDKANPETRERLLTVLSDLNDVGYVFTGKQPSDATIQQMMDFRERKRTVVQNWMGKYQASKTPEQQIGDK
jgi:hypothetical protein